MGIGFNRQAFVVHRDGELVRTGRQLAAQLVFLRRAENRVPPIVRPSSQTWVYFVRSRNRVTRLPRHWFGMVMSRSYQHAPSKRYGCVSPYVERSVLAGPFCFVSVVPGRRIVLEISTATTVPDGRRAWATAKEPLFTRQRADSVGGAVGRAPKMVDAPAIRHSRTHWQVANLSSVASIFGGLHKHVFSVAATQ